MNKGKKTIIILSTILLVLAMGIYFGAVGYFSGHFLPGSTINGRNCSFMSIEDAQQIIAEQLAGYQLTIDEVDQVQEVITAKQIGLKYVDDGNIQKLVDKQDKWKWFLAMGKPNKYTMSAVATYNKEKLKKMVKSLEGFQNMVEPVDARIEEKNGEYYIVPETEGSKLDKKKVLALVRDAVENGEIQIDLVKSDCYIKPSVYQNDEALKKEADSLNRYTRAKLFYDFGDREERVDGDLIKTWLVKGEDGEYSLNEAAMKEYVAGLAEKYDTFGSARQFITAIGNEITVKGGDYGYVINQDQTLAELKKAVMDGESGTRKPVYSSEGICRDTNDIGMTYVEIDLENQKMYFYKDGKLLVETDVVSGNTAKGHATPTGCYALDEKKSPAVVKGEKHDEQVTYWMPFSEKVGICDGGNWQKEFGGKIYLMKGSHGCVTAPVKAAETIYNNIEVGTPIIVY